MRSQIKPEWLDCIVVTETNKEATKIKFEMYPIVRITDVAGEYTLSSYVFAYPVVSEVRGTPNWNDPTYRAVMSTATIIDDDLHSYRTRFSSKQVKLTNGAVGSENTCELYQSHNPKYTIAKWVLSPFQQLFTLYIGDKKLNFEFNGRIANCHTVWDSKAGVYGEITNCLNAWNETLWHRMEMDWS